MALPAKKTKKGAKPAKKSKTAKRTALGILAAAAMAVTSGLAAADPLTVSTSTGVSATLYGTLQFDGIWTDNRSYTSGSSGSSSDVTLWALEQKKGQVTNDAETRLSADPTRFGVNITGPNSDSVVLTGKLETDFYGTVSSGGENAPAIRIRHAYGNISLPDYGFSLLAGQTWDVIAPLNSPILDSGALYDSGNLGARRPQLRLTEGVKFADTGKVDLAVAAVRSIGQGSPLVASTVSGYQTDTGRSADFPALEARLGASVPTWVDKQTLNVGVGGLYGQDQVFLANSAGTATTTQSLNLDVRAVAVDLEIPVIDWISLAGEGYAGENLGQYQGTLGYEYFNPAGDSPTGNQLTDYQGWGAWGALRLKPGSWLINLGLAEDKLTNDEASLPTASDPRVRNITGFANISYLITPTTKIGVEYGRTETDYYDHVVKADNAAHLNRGQLTVAYTF
jgi:hypothetical protein